jgi:hypothetical protein
MFFGWQLDGMLIDMSIATASAAEYKEFLVNNPNKAPQSRIDLEVKVLAAGNWPTMNAFSNIILPNSMLQCQQSFNEFYSWKNPSARLEWVLSAGTVILRAFFNKTYELEVSPLQAVVLLACGASGTLGGARAHHESMSFYDIKSTVSMAEDVLKKVMHSLSINTKIFKKINNDNNSCNVKKIENTDSFVLNDHFKSEKIKFHVPLASLAPPTAMKGRVEENRTYEIDAALVRIMKVRSVMLCPSQFPCSFYDRLSNFIADSQNTATPGTHCRSPSPADSL